MSCRPGDLSVGPGTLRIRTSVSDAGRCQLALESVEPLVVDPEAHAEELARFESNVVRGPGADDCAIWVGAIGGDGYGRNRAEFPWSRIHGRCHRTCS